MLPFWNYLFVLLPCRQIYMNLILIACCGVSRGLVNITNCAMRIKNYLWRIIKTININISIYNNIYSKKRQFIPIRPWYFKVYLSITLSLVTKRSSLDGGQIKANDLHFLDYTWCLAIVVQPPPGLNVGRYYRTVLVQPQVVYYVFCYITWYK
jgi:hypothetical protein